MRLHRASRWHLLISGSFRSSCERKAPPGKPVASPFVLGFEGSGERECSTGQAGGIFLIRGGFRSSGEREGSTGQAGGIF